MTAHVTACTIHVIIFIKMFTFLDIVHAIDYTRHVTAYATACTIHVIIFIKMFTFLEHCSCNRLHKACDCLYVTACTIHVC